MAKRKLTKWTRCPQSNEVQMLAFMPDDKGYPGAVVCIECSFGVLIKKGTAHLATSMTGLQGKAGTVRTHYLNNDKSNPTMKYA